MNRVGSNNNNMGSLTSIVNSNFYARGGYLSSGKVVEVPVQDSRTKALIHKLAS